MLNTTIIQAAPLLPPIRPDLPGNIRLERPLGSGATATVFLARSTEDAEKCYAVKVLTSFLTLQDESRRRWDREATLLLQLDHPNIVKGIASGSIDGRPYLVMEFLQGEALNDRLKRLGKLPQVEVFEVARACLQALEHAHERNIIHRDIKPANIIRLNNGEVKLTDFGLAKLVDDTSLTQSGSIVGTPIYVSPEQARCDKEITIQSDLYSLGVTLFHLAAGRPPFAELNTSLLLTRKITDDVPDVRFVDPEISGGLAYLIAQLCQRDLEQRPASPGAALELMQTLQSGALTTTSFTPMRGSSLGHLVPISIADIPADDEVLQTIQQDSQLETKPHFLEAGKVLFYEDDASRECYVLLSGKVDVLKSGKSIAQISDSGSFIGEMSPLRGVPRSATVRATEDCIFLVVREEDFHHFFLRHANMALALARTLAARLEATNERLTESNRKLAALSKHAREISTILFGR